MRFLLRNLLSLSCLLISFGVTAQLALAAEPSSVYKEVVAALEEGKTVKVISDLSQCAVADGGKPGPSIRGGLQITAFIVASDGDVHFSDVHQMLDLSGKPVTEYVRYRFAVDGATTIDVKRLSDGVIVKKDELICPVPAGVKFVW
jgi:hypothetical protein